MSHEKSAADRFVASMTMDFDKWHDGTGYDLDALAEVPAAERDGIEAMLRARSPLDWRDVEALAQFDTPTARAFVRAAAEHADPAVRRVARQYLPAEAIDPTFREAKLLEALEADDLYGGRSCALDEAAEFHPPAVVDALFRGALNRPGPKAVHCAALLFYVHGKAAEPFDWAHRPFFLRFDGSDGAAAHQAAFRELCERLGVDPTTRGLRP